MTAMKPALYGVMAEFTTAEATVAAVEAAYREGYRRIDAYSPYPVPELADALHFRRTHVPGLVFFGGLLGCVGGYFMQYYFNVINYPLNVGGRPLHSWPAFIPVTFELTILAAVLACVASVLLLNRLPELHHPVWNLDRFSRATQDRFFVCIESRDPMFDPERTRQLLTSLGAEAVEDVPAEVSP